MSNYTRRDLQGYRKDDLKDICDELGLTYRVKETNDALIAKILNAQNSSQSAPAPQERNRNENSNVVSALNAGIAAVREDDGTVNALIYVSCGAASGNYPIVGKSVAAAGELLREALNIDISSTPVVNGGRVSWDYIVQEGDSLEFTKPSGRKG